MTQPVDARSEPLIGQPPSRIRLAALIIAKAVVVGAFFTVWSVVYGLVNAHVSAPERTIHLMPPSAQFPGIIQPWTALVYVFGGFALPVLPFCFDRSWRTILFALLSYGLGSVVSFACYWVWPISIERPEFDDPDPGSSLMRWLQTVDQPGNCCPSSHVLFAVLGALLVGRVGAGRIALAVTWLLAVAVCATTITTGQHYFFDIAGGATTALAAYLLTGRLIRDPPRAAADLVARSGSCEVVT